jgi:hypothetical protein
MHFTGATGLSLNGTPAQDLFVLSDTAATATVPQGAASGPISVTNAGGTGTSAANFVVGTGQVTHFALGFAGARAGVQTTLVVRALDANNQIVTGYSGPVTFNNSVPGATFSDVTWVNGVGTFTAVFPPDPLPLYVTGTEMLSVSDAANMLITGHTVVHVVDPVLAITAPATTTLGAATMITVTAQDPSNQNAVITGYNRPMAISSSDTTALLPGQSMMTNGTLPFIATFDAAGSVSITASDASVPRISVTTTIQVAKITPTATLTASPNPATVGQTATWTVSLGNTVSGVDPSGSVTIAVTVTDAVGSISTQTVSCAVDKTAACVATMPISVAGTYDAVAQYGGNANYNAASSGHVMLNVNKADVTAIVGCSPNPSTLSQKVTCTLRVGGLSPTLDASATSTVAVGLVDLSGHTSALTLSVPVNAAGVGSFVLPAFGLPTTVAGTYTLTGNYPGNGVANKALSNSFVETVNRDGVSESGSCSPNPSVAGSSLMCTFSVSPVDPALPALATTTATMVLTDTLGNKITSTVPFTFNAAGTGSFTSSSLAGAVQINVPYPGDASYAPAVSPPILIPVQKIIAAGSLGCPGTATVSQKFTCTYTLTGGNPAVDASEPAAVTGSFTNLTGQTTPISVPISLDSSGKSTFDLTPLEGGTYQMNVASTGNANYSSAASNIVTVPVYNTPAGSPVTVTLGNVTLTFGAVTQAGNTTVGTSSSGPAPPFGYTSGTPALFYALNTTATVNGPDQICIDHSNQSFLGSAALDMWFLNPSTNTWGKGTTSNTGSTTCGSTNVLSTVALFQPVSCVNDLAASAITTAGRGGRVSTVTLYWTGFPAQSYSVVRNGTAIGNATGPGFVDSSVSPGKTYQFHLLVWDSSDNPICVSNQVSVTVPERVTPTGNP